MRSPKSNATKGEVQEHGVGRRSRLPAAASGAPKKPLTPAPGNSSGVRAPSSSDGTPCPLASGVCQSRAAVEFHASVDRHSTVQTTAAGTKHDKVPTSSAGQQKARSAKPKTCTCKAYAWPHRPGGGLCRWPLAAKKRSNTCEGTNRRGDARVRKSRRWMFKVWGLNPVKDRAEFARLYPVLSQYYPATVVKAKELLAKIRNQGGLEPDSQDDNASWRWLPRDDRGRWSY